MISDLLFMAKMLGLTILVVLIMQFKVGEKTLDQNFHSWIADSVFVDYVQTSIDGGVALTRTGYKKVHQGVTQALNKFGKHHKKDERGLSLNIKRYNDRDEENGEENSILPHSQSRTQKPH